jgi:phage tail sheath protein FI
MTVPLVTGHQAPGVYLQDVYPPPAPSLLTGVPAFLGYADAGQSLPNQPVPLTLWPQFEAQFGAQAAGFLAYAVRGFFENGGLLCYVVRLDGTATPLAALRGGLLALQDEANVDLICAPDIMPTAGSPDVATVTDMQVEVLADCQSIGGRFAILDAILTSDTLVVETQRAALTGDDGALYHPWLWVSASDGSGLYVPPCGHVAGSYASSDQQVGVHKAPANEIVDGVLDLRVNLTGDAIATLYAEGVNCLRAVPGRGIRVWGARTLSGDTGWQSIGARRVFLTMGRWLEAFLVRLTYEVNDVRLWVRIMRELTAYLDGLFQRGALKGRTPAEAFFVKCDAETNPPEVIDAGMVVTNVGLALAAPAEFVVVRVIHGASGVSIQPGSATT